MGVIVVIGYMAVNVVAIAIAGRIKCGSWGEWWRS